MQRLVFALAGGAALLISSPVPAAPPPPPPAFIDALAARIAQTQTARDFDRHAEAFADDLMVTLNGKTIAGSKTAWLAFERHRLGKVDRRLLGLVEGPDSILVLDRYDDRSDLPTSPGLIFDPRYKVRAMRYDVGADRLIHAIRILETEGVMQSEPPTEKP